MERMTWTEPSGSRLEGTSAERLATLQTVELAEQPRLGNSSHRDSHWTMAVKSTQAARQYSAASMIVRTRTVWRGSLGSSLPQVSVGS